MASLSHIELNASDLKKSKAFYGKFLKLLGWTSLSMGSSYAGFKAPDKIHLFINQTADAHKAAGFHRKHVGINHLAFNVKSKVDVDAIAKKVKKFATVLYDSPKDMSKEYDCKVYYALYLEDPDRIKIEIAYIKE